MSIASDGSSRSWPYWLSARETIRVNDFLREDFRKRTWVGVHGKNEKGDIVWLEYLKTETGVLCVRCKFRDQQAPFPFWDMMGEVGKFEIGRKLQDYMEGKIELLSHKEFSLTLARLKDAYNLRNGHYVGDADEIEQVL